MRIKGMSDKPYEIELWGMVEFDYLGGITIWVGAKIRPHLKY